MLAREFIDLGFKAIVCSSNPAVVPNSVTGMQYDAALLDLLPRECDPCAENGEFHTFVYDGPIFSEPLSVGVGDVIERDGFCFADILLVAR